MGQLSKNLKFNNGKLMNFEYLRQNRQEAAIDLSEGNQGLLNLFNTCFDRNITTIASCGDLMPHICFELNEHTRDYLTNLFARLDTEYSEKFILEMGIFKRMNDSVFLNIRIDTPPEESPQYFDIIANILKEDIKYDHYEKFDIYENMASFLSNFAVSNEISKKNNSKDTYSLQVNQLYKLSYLNFYTFFKSLGLTFKRGSKDKRDFYKTNLNFEQLSYISNYIKTKKERKIK